MFKTTLVSLLILIQNQALAGIFDGSPLDPRNPVQVCQAYVDKNFSSKSDLLAACGKVTTRFAYKCLERVSENVGGLSVLIIHTCSFVNNKESLTAVEGLSKHFPMTSELVVAASFSETTPESLCVKGLASRAEELSVRSVMKCNKETLLDYGLRWAKAVAL